MKQEEIKLKVKGGRICHIKPERHSEDLEEEISRTYHDGSVTDTEDIDHVAYGNIARHFYELGQQAKKEQQNEKMKENTLAELIEYLSKRFDVSYAKLARIVVKTAKWQKAQMLKEAVEGEIVNLIPDRNYIKVEREAIAKAVSVFKEGDKVKIVIVKEDKK